MSKIPSIGCKWKIWSCPALEMLADASGIDCAFCLGQNKIFSLSLNQENLDTLLVAETASSKPFSGLPPFRGNGLFDFRQIT
jgi:hypothetical protein